MRAFVSALILCISACAQQVSNVPPVPDYVPANAVRYSIILSGNKAGDEAVWKTADGKVHIFSQFNDRGRGPKIDGTYVLNPQGLPTSTELKGNDYLKSAVEERFTYNGKMSSWQSTVEKGQHPGLTGFYTSF